MSNIVPLQFNFDNQLVRVNIDEHGTPWWVAKDICRALAITDNEVALRRLAPDEKGACSIRTLGGPQEMLVINEPGLYRLIFTSRKVEAERFQRWVFHEVLPAIRQKGAYCSPELLARLEHCEATIEGMSKRQAATDLQVKLFADARQVELVGANADRLRAFITAVAHKRHRLNKSMSFRVVHHRLEEEIRQHVGFHRNKGARWELCPVDAGAKALSLILQLDEQATADLRKCGMRDAGKTLRLPGIDTTPRRLSAA